MAAFKTAEDRLRSNPDVFDRNNNICSGYCRLQCSIDPNASLTNLFQIITVYFAKKFDVFSIIHENDYLSNQNSKITHGGPIPTEALASSARMERKKSQMEHTIGNYKIAPTNERISIAIDFWYHEHWDTDTRYFLFGWYNNTSSEIAWDMSMLWFNFARKCQYGLELAKFKYHS